MNISLDNIRQDITQSVKYALQEDIASGDITAELIPEKHTDTATIITREKCIFCGRAWVEETFAQLDVNIEIKWHAQDGDQLKPNDKIATLSGNTRILLTGERTALNFVQLLSGVATTANDYANLVNNTNIKLLDTRKTVPGLRTAQKYAVNIGGCHNHRIGLYDAYLIKENHIAGCGSITSAIETAKKQSPGKLVEVEVESLTELREALMAKADVVMLDNFSDEMLNSALSLDKGRTKYELSGNLTLEDISKYNDYNIDYISFGALTKHVRAIDLSMRIIK